MCEIKRCRKEVAMFYYGRGVCEDCFHKHCIGTLDLKQEFGIKS